MNFLESYLYDEDIIVGTDSLASVFATVGFISTGFAICFNVFETDLFDLLFFPFFLYEFGF